MTDLATLLLRVDSSQLRRGSADLDRFGDHAARTERRATRFGTAATAAMRSSAGAAAAMLGAFVGVGAAVNTIAGFEGAMAKLSAITRATGGEMERMREIAMQLGASTEFSASQAAEGLTFLGMAGFSAAEGMAAIPAVLDLATAAAMDLGSAADISSNIMSGFGIVAGDASKVADILAAASSRANTDVGQLGAAMKYVAPVAASLGISMNDTAAAIGKLSDAGIQGTMAGTSMRSILASLAAPTKAAHTALDGLGLTVRDVSPQLHSLTDIVDTLAGAGLDASSAMTIFGREAGPAILALTSQAGGLRELTAELGNVEGEALRMANTMRDNLGGDLKGLMSAMEGLVLSIGESGVTGALRLLVQGVTETVRFIASMTEHADKLAIAFAAIAASRVPMLFATLVGAAGSLTAGLSAAAAAAGVLKGALAALGGPVGVLMAAAGGVAAALVLTRDEARSVDEVFTSLEGTTQRLAGVNDTLAVGHDDLAAAKQRLAMTTTQGTEAERAAAAAAVSSVNDRIRANELLRQELAITRQSELNDMHAAQRAAEESYRRRTEQEAAFALVVMRNRELAEQGRLDEISGLRAVDQAAQLVADQGYGAVQQAYRDMLEARVNSGETLTQEQASWLALSGTISEGREQINQAAAAINELTAPAQTATITVDEFGTSAGGAAISLETLGQAAYAAIPGFADLREEYGSAAASVRDLMEAQNALAVANMQDTIEATTSSLGALTDALGMSAGEAMDLANHMRELSEADTLDQQAAAMNDLADYILSAAGGLDQMSTETRAVYEGLVNDALAAAQLAGQIDVASQNAASLSDRIALIASSFGPAISAANTLAGALGGVLSRLGGIAAGLARMSDTGRVVSNALSSVGGVAGAMWDRLGGGQGLLETASAAFDDVGDNLRMLWDKATTAGTTVAELEETLVDHWDTTDSVGKGGKGGAAGSTKKLSEEAKAAKKALDDLRSAAEGWTSRTRTPMEAYRADIAEIQKILADPTMREEFPDFDDTAARAVRELNVELADSMPLLGGVVDTLTEGLFNGFDDTLKSITNIFKRWLIDMIATAAKNQIMVSMGANFGGSVAGAMGGGLMSSAGGMLGGIGATVGAMGSTFMANAGAMLTGAVDMAGFASTMGSAFSSLQGFAAAAGAIAVPLAVATAAFTFFRKTTKKMDEGIRLTTEGMRTAVEQWEEIRTKQFWGLKTSRKTHFSGAGREIANPLSRAVEQMQSGIMDAAAALGVGKRAFRDFSHHIMLSTEDMTEEEAIKALQEEIGGLGEAFARMVPSVNRLRMEGESTVDALTRTATALGTVNAAFRSLGVDGLAESLRGGRIANRLVEASGGLQQFAAATEHFFQNIMSAPDRLKALTDRLNDGLRAANIKITPRNENHFQKMFERMMSNGARKKATALLNLGPLFSQIQQLEAELDNTGKAAGNAADRLAERERKQADKAREREGLERQILRLSGDQRAIRKAELADLYPANRALQRRIYGLEREAAAAERAAERQRERAGLQTQLWTLLGRENKLRKRALAELAPSNRAIQERIWRIEDEREATEKANAIADERLGIQRRIWELTGNTAAIQNDVLAQLDPSNRALQQYVFRLEAQAEATERANAIADERRGLEIEYLTLMGHTASIRAREIEAIEPANRWLQRRIWALEDAAEAEAKAAQAAEERAAKLEAVANERSGLERQLLEVQGKTSALRQLELIALDPSNRAIQRRIWAINDEAAAADRAAERAAERAAKASAIADERSGLERALLELQGKTSALRSLELAALDPSNRALQKRIWALTDEAAKADAAAEKAAERAAKLEAIADERTGLETRLLELQGNTAALRARELDALNPANRALQRMIWGLEDAKEAMDALDPAAFATRLDFDRARGRAINGTGSAYLGGGAFSPAVVPSNQQANNSAAMVEEIKRLRDEVKQMREQQGQLTRNGNADLRRLRTIEERREVIGTPTYTVEAPE